VEVGQNEVRWGKREQVACIWKQDTDKQRVWGLITRRMQTTTVANCAGCSHPYMGAPWNTLASGMSIHSSLRIPTSTVCKENKHDKHAQTGYTRIHGQGTCRQVPGMRARRARAGGGTARTSKEKIRTHKGLCPRWSLATSICLAGCICGTCTMNRARHAQGGCMWITRGIAL